MVHDKHPNGSVNFQIEASLQNQIQDKQYIVSIIPSTGVIYLFLCMGLRIFGGQSRYYIVGKHFLDRFHGFICCVCDQWNCSTLFFSWGILKKECTVYINKEDNLRRKYIHDISPAILRSVMIKKTFAVKTFIVYSGI